VIAPASATPGHACTIDGEIEATPPRGRSLAIAQRSLGRLLEKPLDRRATRH
jgi:hypothetical protein